MLSPAESRGLWARLYARTFLRLQRQYPDLALPGVAHLARDAADAALDELTLELPAPPPRLSVDDD